MNNQKNRNKDDRMHRNSLHHIPISPHCCIVLYISVPILPLSNC
jgi:hypothetical protein